MESVLFLGSSNTFGVGLHTFRDCYLSKDTVVNLQWPYIQDADDNDFIRKNRWTNKIANFLNRNELNVSDVGGSPAAALYKLQITDLSNIDYIFFEFSGIYNYHDRFMHGTEYPKTPHEIEAFLTNGKNDNPELRDRILKWIEKYNPDEFIDTVLQELKKKLEELNDKKIVILFWHDAVHNDNRRINFDSEKYSWLKKYMVKFPTESDSDNYIVHNLIREKKLTVSDEHPLSDLMHKDIHVGIKGNELVTKIVIDYINEKENTNSW